MTSVTRRKVSARGSDPSATAPTASSRCSRSERPAERARSLAPTIASSVPTAISMIRTSIPPFWTPMFQLGLAAAAARATIPTPAVVAGPARRAVTKGAATYAPTIAADSSVSRTSTAMQIASRPSPASNPVSSPPLW